MEIKLLKIIKVDLDVAYNNFKFDYNLNWNLFIIIL